MKRYFGLALSFFASFAFLACGDDLHNGGSDVAGGGGGAGAAANTGGVGPGGSGDSAGCGNGVVDTGEACDDGNTADGDGCSATCASEGSCGNGVVDVGEGCDDGNTAPRDGCSSSCQVEPSVAAGEFFSCALREDRSVKCWGQNGNGQLGLGDARARANEDGEMGASLPSVDLGPGRKVAAMALGWAHACAILDDGLVKCWGSNRQGELGLGDSENRGDEPGEMGASLPVVDLGPGRTALAITAGRYFTCALLDDHSVKCWGTSNVGQLGLGSKESKGDDAGEMGASLPPVNLGPGRTVTAISAGTSYVCAILDDASVRCWGSNSSGQLGLGDTGARGDEAGEMAGSLPTVALGTGRKAVAIATGSSHSCAILDDDSTKCWGSNGSGELGLGDHATRGPGPDEMGDDLPSLDLGTGRKAMAVSLGAYHSCMLLDDGALKCWGGASFGQTGHGDREVRGEAAGEMGDNLPALDLGTKRTALTLSVGRHHGCAVLDDHSIKCWGYNGFGQLGLGDSENRGDGPGEMGDDLPAVDLGP